MLLRQAEVHKVAAAGAQGFADAAVLLRAWARQQQLDQGADGIPGFLLTALLVHLLEAGQAVRGVQRQLASLRAAAARGA